jgi:hypothetical protein
LVGNKGRTRSLGGSEVLQTDDIECSLPDTGQVLVTVHNDDRLLYTLGRDFSESWRSVALRLKQGDEVFGVVNIYGGLGEGGGGRAGDRH